MRDFNDVINQQEKYGRRPFPNNQNHGLKVIMDRYGLINIGYSGPKYTCTNNRNGMALIKERLDRAIVNQD